MIQQTFPPSVLTRERGDDFEENTLHHLTLLTGCELHMHILGAYYADDVLALGKDVYQQVDWHEHHFLETYQAVFGMNPEPQAVFEDALTKSGAGFERLKRLHVYTQEDGGDFARWEAKFNFL